MTGLCDQFTHMLRTDVWGPFIKDTNKSFDTNNDEYNLFDAQCYEKLDLKFYKSILGVHKKSHHAAVRGELGR